MRIITASDDGFVLIGKQGENAAAQVQFPVVEEWTQTYGTGVFQLLILRPTEATPYAVPVTTDGTNVLWTVGKADVAIPGIGGCELRYVVDGTVAKSQSYVTLTDKSIGGSEAPYPTPWEEWVDQVLDAAASAEADAGSAAASASAAQTAQAAAETAQTAAETAQAGAVSAKDAADLDAALALEAKAAAQTSASSASQDAADAAASQAAAAASALSAESSADAASYSASAAQTAQGKAETAQTAAETAQAAAEAAEDTVAADAAAAAEAKNTAVASASAAADSETAAAASETAAEAARTAAEAAQTAAEAAQTAAEASQTAAEGSAEAASGSASAAAVSATAAETAQTAAETAATFAESTQPCVYRTASTENGSGMDNVWTVHNAADRKAQSVIIRLDPKQSGTPSASSPAAITGYTSYSIRQSKGNLFDPERAETGMYITNNSGSLYEAAAYWTTDLIPVSGISSLRMRWKNDTSNNRTARITFYDADKNYLPGSYYGDYGSNKTAFRTGTRTVPSGAAYVRFGCYNSGYLTVEGDSSLIVNAEAFPEAAGTVYGGTVDVTNGKLYVTWGSIASYAGETLPGRWLSSMDVYEEGTTPTTGAQVVYELAEPVVYDMTPHEIRMTADTMLLAPASDPYQHAVSVTYNVSDLINAGDVDSTLAESGKPADAKSAGDGIRVNAEAIESLVGSSLFPFTYNWDYQKTEAKPYGWRQGYYRTDDGEFTDSSTYKTNYLCNNTVIIRMYGAAAFSIEAPQNYWVKISKYNSSDGTYVGVLATVPAGEKQYFILDDNGNDYHYRYTCGNFNGSSASYLNDDFIKSIKLVIYNRTQKQIYYKKYEDDNAFFTVTVDRPLTFDDENVVTGTEEIECAFKMPSSYRSTGKPTRMILACHGSEGYIKASTNHWGSGNYKPFMQAMVDAGYGVFDANIFETSTGTSVMGKAFGSPMYINVLKKAYDYLLQNYNIYPEIFAHGISMGGLGATAFAHAYPSIVLAESSFAGRSILTYLSRLVTSGISDGYGVAYGYESNAALADDKFSRVTGVSPELSIIKYVNGSPQLPPDRATDYDNWLAYFAALADLTRSDEVPDCIGHRSVPYKAWNSWADNEGCTKLEEVLKKAYTTGNSAPYYTVTYDSGTHADMCYGGVNDMRNQLLCWFKRWE